MSKIQKSDSEGISPWRPSRHTMDYLKKIYGKPIFQVDFPEYSQDEKLINDIPDSVVVFATSRKPERIIVYGKVRGDKWLPNYGSRALIKRLLTLNKIL